MKYALYARQGKIDAFRMAKLAYGLEDFAHSVGESVSDLIRGTATGLGEGGSAFARTYGQMRGKDLDPFTSSIPAVAHGIGHGLKGFYEGGGIGGAARIGGGLLAISALKKVYEHFVNQDPPPTPEQQDPYVNYARAGVY
jgi:hypothetical protein